MGKERLRQHLKVPAVPADRQRGGRDRGVHRRLHHTGRLNATHTLALMLTGDYSSIAQDRN